MPPRLMKTDRKEGGVAATGAGRRTREKENVKEQRTEGAKPPRAERTC